MFKVNSRKVIARLSVRSLKAARLRNLMAVCAIALTAVLFTTLFTLGIGTFDAFQQATMRQSGASGHAVAKYIDDAIFDKISAHPLVKEISYTRMLSDNVNNLELIKRHGEFWYMDDAGLKNGFCEPTTGSRPIAENEIIMDTKAMQLLNIPQEIGAAVKLNLTVKGEQVERDFVLSGWWESDPVFNVSLLVTSRAYVDAHIDELINTYREDYSPTGVINAYIMFGNTFNMEQKLHRVLVESGYDIINPDAPNYVECNVNWAYLMASMSGFDPAMAAALIAAALLIVFTGYLIIYNIFQISVLRDIRYYGLLKTIGTTGRQIQRIIRRQAVALSMIGIPIGLVLGFLVGSRFVPLVLALTYYGDAQVTVAPNPFIFIGAGLFAAVTVWLSTRKPGKIAAKVSPVEAVRYTESGTNSKKQSKRTTDGGKFRKMALSNLGRNKKNTVLTLISLSLSLVLLNSVFTLSRGLDIDKYISAFVDSDFLFAHAEYFNSHYSGAETAVEEEAIQTLECQQGFEAGGRLYSTRMDMFSVEDAAYTREFNVMEDGHPYSMVYGLDDFPLGRLEVIDGKIDIEKLKSGDYILEGVSTDDFGRPMMETSHFDVGEKVTLHNNRIKTLDPYEREYVTQEFEVMAKVIIKQNTNANRSWNEYTLYLPSNIYLPLVYDKAVMSYAFNVENSLEGAMEDFMKNFTANVEPLMSYESKAVKADEFAGLRNMILAVGGILSGIIGMIGVLNFVNSILTGLITRRREFAMLQSIGMTKKQLRKMLCLEGLYYAAGTVLFSLALGLFGSVFMIQNIMSGFWFASYRFVIAPLMVCWPVLIVFSLLLPVAAFVSVENTSVVERLREVE